MQTNTQISRINTAFEEIKALLEKISSQEGEKSDAFSYIEKRMRELIIFLNADPERHIDN